MEPKLSQGPLQLAPVHSITRRHGQSAWPGSRPLRPAQNELPEPPSIASSTLTNKRRIPDPPQLAWAIAASRLRVSSRVHEEPCRQPRRHGRKPLYPTEIAATPKTPPSCQ